MAQAQAQATFNFIRAQHLALSGAHQNERDNVEQQRRDALVVELQNLVNGLQQNNNVQQNDIFAAYAAHEQGGLADIAVELNVLRQQHEAAESAAAYHTTLGSVNQAQVAATAAVQGPLNLLGPDDLQLEKVVSLEGSAHDLEVRQQQLEQQQQHQQPPNYYWPQDPPPQAQGIIIDGKFDEKRIRLVLSDHMHHVYLNLQQAGGFVPPVVQPGRPHDDLQNSADDKYSLPNHPVTAAETKHAINTMQSMWPAANALLLTAHAGLCDGEHQNWVHGSFLLSAWNAPGLAAGMQYVQPILAHGGNGGNTPPLAVFAIRRDGGSGFGPIVSPVWFGGNAGAGFLSTWNTTYLVGLDPGSQRTLPQLALEGYDRVLVVNINMLFSEACTSDAYVNGSNSREMAMGACFYGPDLGAVEALLLCSHQGGFDANGPWKQVRANKEFDCIIPLMTACLVGATPRGWIRMAEVSC